MFKQKLVKKFYIFTKSYGIDTCGVCKDDFTAITFVDKDTSFMVYVVFYNNKTDDVEIQIKKSVNKNYAEDLLLREMNRLNNEYLSVAFLLESGNVISTKSFIQANGNLDIVLNKLAADIEAAKMEFKHF